jgi:M6 family metalloprotease-like protein
MKSQVPTTQVNDNRWSESWLGREVLCWRSGRQRAQGCVHVLGALARSRTAAKRVMLLFVVFVFSASRPAQADPVFGKIVELRQPDGSIIQTRVWGDEFYRVVESLDGYTLVRDPVSRIMCYARLSADANDLVSTGVSATAPLPTQMQIERHIRIKKQAAAARLEAARARFAPGQSQSNSPLQASSTPPTTGTVRGICLLVDFADEPQRISPSDVNDFCNKHGYGGNGNNGSVRDYFYDVSDGHLTYTNYVTPIYYRARYSKAYYDDPSATEGTRARDLVLEALLWLDAQGFDFSQYDSNGDGIIDGISCLYAGSRTADGGLWPHSWVVTFSADGVSAYRYLISDLGTAPHLGTFCHESGHMLCDWPDLYDRDWNGQQYDSTAIGDYCLMCYGSRFENNPPEPCAYLKALANWATVTTLTVPQSGLTVTAGVNSFFKFRHPKLSNEYYLVENREQSGRDAHLPDSGLAIWHIDENGNNDNEQMTPESHYQVTLVQADGKWDMENNRNSGDETDLFDTLTLTEFNPSTDPNSGWWAGGPSALSLSNISASGQTMTFDFALDESPPLGRDGVFGITSGDSATIRVHGTDDYFPNPPGDLTYVISSLPEHGTLEDPAAGPITEAGTALADFGNVVIYHPEDKYLGVDAFGFKAYDGGSAPNGGYSDEAIVSVRISPPIYVDDDAGNDPGPGDPSASDPLEDGSAEHPFDAIQKAIDFAISSESIIVRAGTYTGRGNHDIDFGGKPVKIRSEDGPATCIIDCRHLSSGFIFQNGETADALLDGLTIINGQAFMGGAISCEGGSSPTIANCTFSNNAAVFSGGALYIDGASPAVTGCTFSGNSGMWGGAMSNNYGASPSVTNCTFTHNRATDWAGAMENFGFCSPTITGCTFSGNVAAGDGGGIYDFIGAATFENCTFSDNSAANGGAMGVEGSFPILTGCAFSANRAAENGGGMYNLDSEPNVANCLFHANASQQAGGVMYNADSNAVLTNCTLADNLASAGSGGAQNAGSSHLILTSCILWGNGRMQIYPAESVTASYTDCAVEGRLPLPGVGNFNVDPNFADPANGDYHLKSLAGRWDPLGRTWVVDEVTSLCIDAGDPAGLFDLEPAPNGSRINMGVYGGTAEASKSVVAEPQSNRRSENPKARPLNDPNAWFFN